VNDAVMSSALLGYRFPVYGNKSLRRYNNQTGGNPEVKEAEVYSIAVIFIGLIGQVGA